MMINSYIHAYLRDLFEILDARSEVSIFSVTKGKKISFVGHLREGKLYEILTDTEFLNTYGACKVNGISITLGKVNIQIEDEGVTPNYESASVVQNVEV